MTQIAALLVNTQEIAQAVADVIEAADIGFRQIYVGHTDLIPKFPACVVEPLPKTRELNEVGGRFKVTLGVQILVIVGKVQATTTSAEEAADLAERVEEALHADKSLGGRVLFGYVSRVDVPGIAVRQNAMLRAARVVWTAQSREGF